ncbi:alpha/beta fold hydrolase [Streptomyces sp. SPB074]|uniref:alpha/beta fold hydrolase n=1 Tax=Streptomyces sp. (strain SPB074) TaxID=465543 RepID=UPI0001D1DD93|nr:alpha/beta hydrolase [Streptomyces sp. SPB074]EFG65176.1 alpha/beta hydrolase fold protein [Streptomyces sp. SPB074]
MADSAPLAGLPGPLPTPPTAAGRRRAGVLGAAVGVLAAGAAAGVAVERLTVGRSVRRRARLALDATSPYGTLRGTPGFAHAADGTPLAYEIEEPGEGGGVPRAGEARCTVVLSHGYCLSQDAWHHQRAALRARGVRAVYWDQRGHGRSGWTPGAAPPAIDLLGGDLKAVIDAAAPTGPLVLLGHSMGGMTVMALAERYPDLVRERVAGLGLIGTSAGRLDQVAWGLPAPGAEALRRLAPGVLRALGSAPALAERGRRAVTDVFGTLVRRYSFGAGAEIDPALARFATRMIEATPMEVVAAFWPAFAAHDKTAALPLLTGRPAFVLAGTDDLITPASHSRTLAAALPEADLTLVPGAGHLVPLERPEEVGAALAALLAALGAG